MVSAIRLARRASAALLAAPVLLLAEPGVAGDGAVIRSAVPLGPYIEIHLAGGTDRSVLLPGDPVCAQMAQAEASVEWVKRGFPGRMEAGGEACEAAGILDLEAWRDRQPRPQVRLAPRKTARWEILHRDGRRALLRGQFPLAPLVGMVGAGDLVAVVADAKVCAGVLESQEGSLEYHASGHTAFRLVAGGSRCKVLGFARPPIERDAGADATSFGAEGGRAGEGPAQSW